MKSFFSPKELKNFTFNLETDEITNRLKTSVVQISGFSDKPEEYYNAKTNICLVKLNGNQYPVYILNNEIFPNPDKHLIFWIYNQSVLDYPIGGNVPETIPATAGISIGFIMNKSSVYRDLVASTASSAVGKYRNKDSSEKTVYEGATSSDITEQTGLSFDHNGQVHLKGKDGSIYITDEGIHFDGTVHNLVTQKRGLLKENPISFFVPETIVTFPASMKNIPALDEIENIANTLSILEDLASLLKG